MTNPQPKPQRVYVTRYALTSGVYRTNLYSSNLYYTAFVKNPQGAIVTLKFGKSVFLTYEEAKKDFEKRKAFAIRCAERKLQNLKNLEFSFTEC
ncbi:hypothetical protein Mic1_19 [Microcystis phage Mic1]|nr:hypothetical protein Mic1_19 [Microcystis phage Mic1]